MHQILSDNSSAYNNNEILPYRLNIEQGGQGKEEPKIPQSLSSSEL